MKIYLLFFLLIALTSCASLSFTAKEKKMMESWTGHNKSELMRSWGPPTRTTGDGQGGEILIYDRAINAGQTPGTVYTQTYSSNLYYTAPQNNMITRSRMFYVDRDGKIYYWRCEGRRGY